MAVVLVLYAGVARAQEPATHMIVDRVVAVVDGDPILLSTLRLRAAPSIHSSHGVPGFKRQEQLHRLYRALLEQLIDERLVEHAAQEAGIKADRAAVDRALQTVMAENHLGKRELLRAVHAAGMTEKQYRSELGRQLVEQRLFYAFLRKRRVSLDGRSQKEQARITKRERKRWMAGLRLHASVQRYYQP